MANMTIHPSGKISLPGQIFDNHGSYDFEPFLDTGCTHMLVIDRGLADAVCAPVDREEVVSVGAGGASINGFIRLVDVRFGEMELRNVRAFVPCDPIPRSLMGISLLQGMRVLWIADFGSGRTDGSLLTSERDMAQLLGKVLHYRLLHGKALIDMSPCDICPARI